MLLSNNCLATSRDETEHEIQTSTYYFSQPYTNTQQRAQRLVDIKIKLILQFLHGKWFYDIVILK